MSCYQIKPETGFQVLWALHGASMCWTCCLQIEVALTLHIASNFHVSQLKAALGRDQVLVSQLPEDNNNL